MALCFLLTTHGLDDVAAAEITATPGLTLRGRGYRRLLIEGPADRIADLRLVDDAFALLATWEAVPHTRAALTDLPQRFSRIDPAPALAALGSVRRINDAGPSGAFSLTVSFVGKRNWSGPELKTTLAPVVAARLRRPYSERDDEAVINVRVFIDHDTAHVGLRLARRPLQDRAWKQAHQPGSLKPPVAAVLAFLAGAGPGRRVLDPCCGAGTILAESAARGATIIGGDAHRDALAMARTNLPPGAVLAQWDACRLPLAAAAVDAVICNPPWGDQVAITAAPERFYRALASETARVLRPGGSTVVLIDAPDGFVAPGLVERQRIAFSLAGRTPTILVLERRI